MESQHYVKFPRQKSRGVLMRKIANVEKHLAAHPNDKVRVALLGKFHRWIVAKELRS